MVSEAGSGTSRYHINLLRLLLTFNATIVVVLDDLGHLRKEPGEDGEVAQRARDDGTVHVLPQHREGHIDTSVTGLRLWCSSSLCARVVGGAAPNAVELVRTVFDLRGGGEK